MNRLPESWRSWVNFSCFSNKNCRNSKRSSGNTFVAFTFEPFLRAFGPFNPFQVVILFFFLTTTRNQFSFLHISLTHTHSCVIFAPFKIRNLLLVSEPEAIKRFTVVLRIMGPPIKALRWGRVVFGGGGPVFSL